LRGVSIAYNILNLPKLVSKGSENIIYIYSAAGEKLAKQMNGTTIKYYAGNMVYNNDKSLKYLLFDEGLVNKVSGGYAYEYHLKDHLGNTRVTFQPNGSGTTTTQVAEYYPFGSSYLPISPAGTNKYLYNGKEKQDDVLGGTALDWYDYGARFYDPTIGRWHSIDMVSESFFWHSPYSYSFNNPIKYYDPNGMWPEPIHNVMLDIFRGMISKKDLAILRAASKEADTQKYQTPELSYRHAMGGSAKDYNNFINEQFGLALKASDRSKGLEQLGYALHAIMDNSSPTHKGFQIWGGKKHPIDAAMHWRWEQWEAYTDPNNLPDIILAMQEMKELYELFDKSYGTTLIDEVTVTAKKPEGSKSLDARIQDMMWQSVRPNANGNTGRYNQQGRSTDQNYSDDFLKWYYGK
jgi:RHS repeat-associated protein